jgi:hypothetical protein
MGTNLSKNESGLISPTFKERDTFNKNIVAINNKLTKNTDLLVKLANTVNDDTVKFYDDMINSVSKAEKMSWADEESDEEYIVNIGSPSANSSNMNTHSANSSNMNTHSANSSNMNTHSANSSNMNPHSANTPSMNTRRQSTDSQKSCSTDKEYKESRFPKREESRKEDTWINVIGKKNVDKRKTSRSKGSIDFEQANIFSPRKEWHSKNNSTSSLANNITNNQNDTILTQENMDKWDSPKDEEAKYDQNSKRWTCYYTFAHMAKAPNAVRCKYGDKCLFSHNFDGFMPKGLKDKSGRNGCYNFDEENNQILYEHTNGKVDIFDTHTDKYPTYRETKRD